MQPFRWCGAIVVCVAGMSWGQSPPTPLRLEAPALPVISSFAPTLSVTPATPLPTPPPLPMGPAPMLNDKDAPSAPPTPPAPPAPVAIEATPKTAAPPPLEDAKKVVSTEGEPAYGLKSLFDSLHNPSAKGKSWYEKINLRGYTQFRFARTIHQGVDSAAPYLFGDHSITGNTENFSIRRVRLILFGDISEHLALYIQPDFSSTPQGSNNSTFFGQLRDAYGDVYFDKEKVHRLRVGLSKVPFGFENMQSSQNRGPLDRTDALNTVVSPNERDLGVFYYWTPVEKQKLFRELVEGGLKGSGNYGIVGFGVYNGQGGSQFEQNLNLHAVARVTWPWELSDGQIVETSLQGYIGQIVLGGSDIRPLGMGDEETPRNTGGNRGLRDQRVGATFVWYPQPLGFQAEWNVGEGPGLNREQTAVDVRGVQGGYLMAMYRHDTLNYGIVMPFVRWQYFKGGYRSVANAPYGRHDEWNIGIEWQIRKEMELVVEYDLVNGANLTAIDRAGVRSYRDFDGGILRVQFQLNY